jgi:Tat protein secretion system quality control protein TatD with DNase activity
LAALRQMQVEEIAAITSENFDALFKGVAIS